MQQLSVVGMGYEEINNLPQGTIFTKPLDELDYAAYAAYKARQQAISVAAADETQLFSLDLRDDAQRAACPDPFKVKIESWGLAKQLGKFTYLAGTDSINLGGGWDIAPAGAWVFKLVGVYWRTGVAAFIPHILKADGTRYPSILLARHFPGVDQYNISRPDQGIKPYYGDSSGGWSGGFTGPEGDLGMAYGPGNVMGTNGGVDVIWPVASPPGLEPQYCDALGKLGWVGGSDHLNPNPVFQLVKKSGGPGPDPDPDPDPDPPPVGEADLVFEVFINGQKQWGKRYKSGFVPVD